MRPPALRPRGSVAARAIKAIAALAALATALPAVPRYITSARAADSPYLTHCDAKTDVGGYYSGEVAQILIYTGDEAAKIVNYFFDSGYYLTVQEIKGATTLWIGIDDGDDTAAIFFYGDNGCAFGYDDTWDRDSIQALLSSVGLPLPTVKKSP